MEQTKGLSAQIPASLHARVTAERVAANQSLSEYMTELLTNYFENGEKNNMAKIRTLAFQIDENLFQRIKEHLSREYERTGTKLTQRDFVLGLIEDALRQAEQEVVDTTDSGTGIDSEEPMSGQAVEAEAPPVDAQLVEEVAE